jgi:hypothetical protein
MTRAVVNPGICGMAVTVEVAKASKRMVRVEITSNCEKVTEMGEPLLSLNQFDALKPQIYSAVYKCASEHHLCASCPVPMAILKAIEVEVGLALPYAVVVHLETTE